MGDCRQAFEKLGEVEKDQVALLAQRLTGKLNERHTGFSSLGLGMDGALELIAKLGIFLNARDNGHNSGS
jgi:hypothetical protein